MGEEIVALVGKNERGIGREKTEGSAYEGT
jgi:hypothetical protein